MPVDTNRPWQLETFLDSVILDLDRAVDTLSVKKDNVRMTYTVQDLSLSLKVFPVFDGDAVRFVTAQPGQEGASTVSVQLGSIRDTQIQEIARRPPSRDETPLDQATVSPQERRQLEKLGLRSAEDVVRTVEGSNVDIDRLTNGTVDYRRLAEVLRRAHRGGPTAPRVEQARFEPTGIPGLGVLSLAGGNLAPDENAPAGYPSARLGDREVPVRASPTGRALAVAVPFGDDPLAVDGLPVTVTLDPYAEITMRLAVHARPAQPREAQHG